MDVGRYGRVLIVITVFSVLMGMGFAARFTVLERGGACVCNKGHYVRSRRDLRVVFAVCWWQGGVR